MLLSFGTDVAVVNDYCLRDSLYSVSGELRIAGRFDKSMQVMAVFYVLVEKCDDGALHERA